MIISILYIGKYDAEKIAMLSSFELIGQKAQIRRYISIKKDPQTAQNIQDKSKIIRNFESILRTGDGCLDDTIKQKIQQTLSDIKAEPVTTFNQKEFFYSVQSNEFRTEISKTCN